MKTMKTISLSAYLITLLFILNGSVSPLFAQAPTRPKILFTSVPNGNYEVFMMNPDGSEQVNLTQHIANDSQAVWSPSGDRILFVSDRERDVEDLYLMNPDGSEIRRVFKGKKRRVNRSHPTWSPDSRQIAYAVTDWNRSVSTIYIATLGEEKEEELVIGGTDPAWAPDGTGIACSIEERLIFVDLRTGARKQFLPKKAVHWQRSPSLSAAGDKLVFSGNNHPVVQERHLRNEWQDKNTIFIVNSDGTGLQQLVAEAGPFAWAPELSPDGQEVLYTQAINGAHQILKIDVHSDSQTQLTQSLWNFGGDWFDPAYALPVSPQPNLRTALWGALKTSE